jgi:hypothetical protein
MAPWLNAVRFEPSGDAQIAPPKRRLQRRREPDPERFGSLGFELLALIEIAREARKLGLRVRVAPFSTGS